MLFGTNLQHGVVGIMNLSNSSYEPNFEGKEFDYMSRYFKHYIWFWKESFKFMKGTNRLVIAWGCLKKAPSFTKYMVKWDNMTLEQREQWYLSGEGRTIEF